MPYVPDNGEQLAIQGWRALRAGDYGYAQHCFRAAINLDPYAPSPWAGLSRATQEHRERMTYMQAAFDLHYLITQVKYNRQYD
jgi:Flp pilus assembly protein TadD